MGWWVVYRGLSWVQDRWEEFCLAMAAVFGAHGMMGDGGGDQ